MYCEKAAEAESKKTRYRGVVMKVLINAPFCEKNMELISASVPECTFVEKSEIEYADIIIGDIPEDCYGRLGRLKWLQLTSAGADKIIYGGAVGGNVILTTASGAFGEIIAEYAVGGILCLYRDFFRYRKNQERKQWNDTKRERMILDSRVLILGCGNIGQCVSQRLRAFGAFTVGIRRLNSPCPDFNRTRTTETLDEELKCADIVVCALPRTPETEHILNRERLSLMKKDALIVNVGRGNAIDTPALIERLQNGELYGAVLDVFEQEPLPADSPLWEMDNVLLTPHISGRSFGYSMRTEGLIAQICIDNLRNYISGKPLKNVIAHD